MQKMRHFTEAETAGLKADTRAAVRMAGGAAKAHLVTRASETDLSKYGSLSHAVMVPLDVAVEIDREIGQPYLVAAAAALLGFRLVPIDDGGEPGTAEIDHADIGDLAAASAHTVSAISMALADGKLCPVERREIRQSAAALAVIAGGKARKAGAR